MQPETKDLTHAPPSIAGETRRREHDNQLDGEPLERQETAG